MISRRHIRIKVMQALYSFFQGEDKTLIQVENELKESIEKAYDSYLLLFLLVSELAEISRIYAEDKPEKYIKVIMSHKANTRFYDNIYVQKILNDTTIQTIVKQRKLTWQKENDVLKKLFNDIKESSIYSTYTWSTNNLFEEDNKFIIDILKEIVFKSDLFLDIMEEKSLYWTDDKKLVLSNFIKTVKTETQFSEQINIFPKFRDIEDKQFMLELLRKTIINDKDFEKRISKKTVNWDLERIALIDVILMKMALAEMISFPDIPEKVTINEFLEIAKEYSTENSHNFINGIIDNIRMDMEHDGLIAKTGKGLLYTDKPSHQDMSLPNEDKPEKIKRKKKELNKE